MTETKYQILPWTKEVNSQARKTLDLIFAAILAPDESIYVEMKGLIHPDVGDRSKFAGEFSDPHRTLAEVAELCCFLIEPQKYRPEHNVDGSRWDLDLIIGRFYARNYSAHQALEARQKLPLRLREKGATQDQLDRWLRMIP